MEKLEHASAKDPHTPVASSRHTEKSGFNDPWNWKMPQRRDTMTLNTLTETKDLCRVKTAIGLRTNRIESNNMNAGDIRGAAPKVEIPKEVKRQHFYDNKDIEHA